MKKRTYMRTTHNWTSPTHKDVCFVMRQSGPNHLAPSNANAGRKTAVAIQAYMKHTAPVAPTVPMNARNARGANKSPLVLWRGASTNKVPVQGTTVSSNGGCFTAFSLQKETAEGFAYNSNTGIPVVYRLRVDRIARGTPWVWFTDELMEYEPPRNGRLRQRNSMWTQIYEGEVLLPPGHYKVLSVSKRSAGVVADVAFSPLPQYVRRGILPKVERADTVVAKTIGGHRLELKSKSLARNVQGRRSDIDYARLKKAAKQTTRTARSKPRPLPRPIPQRVTMNFLSSLPNLPP